MGVVNLNQTDRIEFKTNDKPLIAQPHVNPSSLESHASHVIHHTESQMTSPGVQTPKPV